MDNKSKYLFEHKFISRRVEFIESASIEDFDKEYLKTKLLEFSKKDYSGYYLALLIDLAIDSNIINNDLLDAYTHHLFSKNHYLVKLSSLDYIFVAKEFISNKLYFVEKLMQFLQRKHEFLLVKNQTLLLLTYLDGNNSDKYLNMLRLQLSITMDYRSHIRLCNTIINFQPLTEKEREILWILIDVSKNMDLGRAVSEKIKEVEIYIS